MAGAWVETDNVSAVNLNEKAIENTYPVGSIYMNASDSTNPATLLGVGTWERFGQGRVLVSQDGTDADFDTIGETGGEKEHTLTEAEMPSHNHTGSTSTTGNHSHTGVYTTTDAASGIDAREPNSYYSSTYYGSDRNYRLTGTTGNHSHSISNSGSDSPHNNLQPYITVYMWVRTA